MGEKTISCEDKREKRKTTRKKTNLKRLTGDNDEKHRKRYDRNKG